jgi:Holliday junction resolvasome RuvABC endonuclease subunit
MTLLKLDGRLGPDAADAVGVALCHAYSRQTQHALAAATARGRRA